MCNLFTLEMSQSGLFVKLGIVLMQITVEYSAQVKRAAGTAADSLQFEEQPTLQDVLQRIVRLHGDELRKALLAESGGMHPSVLTFVGENQIRSEQNPSLSDGDVVAFLSPISGG